MIEVPIDVQVECTNGRVGTLTHVIINPTTKTITHFVVSDNEQVVAHSYLVPVESISETRHDVIRLNVTIEELSQMDQFTEVHYIANPDPEPGYPADAVYLAPYVSPLESGYLSVEVERIPVGEMAVRRGAVIEATDGFVGHLGEFLLDPESGQLTHLVLQEGHSWGKREITLPVSIVDQALENTIYLKLDKAGVAKLPAIPLKRDYGKSSEPEMLELLAKIFDTPDGASTGLKQLKALRKKNKGVFKIRNVAVVVKDSEGEFSIKETADVDTKQGRLFGTVAGGLIGLVGGPVGVIIGALAGAGAGAFAAKHIDMGFSNQFLDSLKELLQPRSSALLILAENKGSDELFEALVDRQNIVLRHTLTDKIVDELLQADNEATDDNQNEEG